MAKERALTLEALRVMDAIDRRGSFAAAADELGRVPSALSYTMQKLEEELDVVLFDRSGHRTKFTNVGRNVSYLDRTLCIVLWNKWFLLCGLGSYFYIAINQND